jgi:hypothetical protein
MRHFWYVVAERQFSSNSRSLIGNLPLGGMYYFEGVFCELRVYVLGSLHPAG